MSDAAPIPGQPKPEAARFISRSDIVITVFLPIFFLAAWFLPARLLPRFARAGARLRRRLRPEVSTKEARRIASIFKGMDGAALDLEFHTQFYLERLRLFRLHRPGAKLLPAELVGAANIEAALARGHGALLWIMPTCHHSVMTKAVLQANGFRVAHLSRTDHRYSGTAYGERFLNPLRTRIENRYLSRRIVIDPDNMSGALAEIQRRLENNEIVSITVGQRARKIVSVRFLDARINVAARPAELAAQVGAPLLPVVTLALADNTSRTEIGASILGDGAPAESAAAGLAAFLEPFARAYPAQFADMLFMAPPAAL